MFDAKACLASLCLALMPGCGGHNQAAATGPASPGAAPGAAMAAPAGKQLQTLIQTSDGQEVPAQYAKSTLSLRFSVDAPDFQPSAYHFYCRLDNATTFSPCNDSLNFQLLINNEAHTVAVYATRLSDQAEASMATVSFKVALDGFTSAYLPRLQPSAPTMPQAYLAGTLQVGSFIAVTIPSALHVTEYSTTKTPDGQVHGFQITSGLISTLGGDPTYTQINQCQGETSARITSGAYNYCASTQSRDAYKASTGATAPFNHLELATSPLPNTSEASERLWLGAFDKDYEYMFSRTRFENLCSHSSRKQWQSLTIYPAYFAGEDLQSDVWSCQTLIPGVNGAPEVWNVYAFFNIDQASAPSLDQAIPGATAENPNGTGGPAPKPGDTTCAACYSESYIAKKALEVVYMARPNAETAIDFTAVLAAQNRVYSMLSNLTPFVPRDNGLD